MCLDLDPQKLKSSTEPREGKKQLFFWYSRGAGLKHLDCGTRLNLSLNSIIHYVTLRKLLNPTSAFFICKNVFIHL